MPQGGEMKVARYETSGPRINALRIEDAPDTPVDVFAPSAPMEFYETPFFLQRGDMRHGGVISMSQPIQHQYSER